jgi:hypothetical protein
MRAFGCERFLITERGTTFGYNNLVADMRSLYWIRKEGLPVVFDATHSVQRPGGLGGTTGGDGELAPVLARAAVATGVDGLFMEVHSDPANAFSDGPTRSRSNSSRICWSNSSPSTTPPIDPPVRRPPCPAASWLPRSTRRAANEAAGTQKISAVSVLPDGSELHGVLIPRYNERRQLVGVLKADSMTLVNRERVSAKRCPSNTSTTTTTAARPHRSNKRTLRSIRRHDRRRGSRETPQRPPQRRRHGPALRHPRRRWLPHRPRPHLDPQSLKKPP